MRTVARRPTLPIWLGLPGGLSEMSPTMAWASSNGVHAVPVAVDDEGIDPAQSAQDILDQPPGADLQVACNRSNCQNDNQVRLYRAADAVGHPSCLQV